MRTLAIAILACLISVSADAQSCDVRLTDIKKRGSYVVERSQFFKSLMNEIERVPPDVVKYLEFEIQNSLSLNNISTYKIATSNKFYAAYDLRRHYDVFIQNIEAAADTDNNQEQAVYMSVVLSRFQEFSEALKFYISYDKERNIPVLTKDKIDEVWFRIPVLKGSILTALQCSIRQLRN